MCEEIGIVANISDLKYLGDTIKTNYIVDTYLYVTDDEIPILKLQEEEVVDAMWVDIDDMIENKNLIVDGVWKRYCQFEEKIK